MSFSGARRSSAVSANLSDQATVSWGHRRAGGIRSLGQTINRFKYKQYKQLKKVKSLKQATELLNKQKRLNVLKKQLKKM
jgi:hypothetical protein